MFALVLILIALLLVAVTISLVLGDYMDAIRFLRNMLDQTKKAVAIF